jgi:hypothetical protein
MANDERHPCGRRAGHPGPTGWLDGRSPRRLRHLIRDRDRPPRIDARLCPRRRARTPGVPVDYPPVRPVYAVQFEVRSPASASAPIHAVREIASNWVRQWYQKWKGIEIVVPLGGGVIEPLDLHRVEVVSAMATTGQSVWSVVWSYPAEPDDTLLWQSSVTASEADSVIEVAIIIRIASREFRLAPLSFDVRRPYIVKTLVDTLPCYLGGRQLRGASQSVGVEDIASFETLLFDRNRRLPLVVFSRDPYTDLCLASPERVADTLVGLAEVHVLSDKWAAFRLTSAVGRALSCFNGAARIYWPGLTSDASPLRHKLFMPNEVRDLGPELPDYLMRRIAPITGLRLTDLVSARKARSALEADRAREANQLRENLKAGTAATEQVEAEFFKLIEEREAATSARNTAEAERDDAQFRVRELDDENRQLKENLAALSAYQPTGRAGPPVPPEPPEPESVRAALDQAAKSFADRLIVWPSAERTAEMSAFARPSEVYQALMAIRELAEAHFKSKIEGRAVGPWEDWFEKRGFKYAAKESQNTLSMYGSDRDFTHKGDKRRMVRHLTLGGGDRANCLQIYFDIDDDAKRVLIGYCGVHLPYYGMRT